MVETTYDSQKPIEESPLPTPSDGRGQGVRWGIAHSWNLRYRARVRRVRTRAGMRPGRHPVMGGDRSVAFMARLRSVVGMRLMHLLGI